MSLETPSPRKLALLVGLAAVVTGAVAVGLLANGGQPSPHVGHDASERYAALDGLNGTVVTTVERGNGTERTVRAVSMRPSSGQIRLAPVADSTTNGTTVVSNGSVKWTADHGTRLVRRTDADALRERLRTRGTRIERLFDRALGDTDTASPERTPGVAPLPVVPHGPETPDAPATNRSEGEFTVEYDGTETIAGREVHVLHVRSREGAATNVSQTLWVDSEWFVPLKYRTQWVEDGELVTATVEYRRVTLEPGLSADVFEYEPPANVAVVTPELGVNAAERIQSIDGLTATLHRRYEGGPAANVTDDGPVETVQRVKMVPGAAKRRVEILDSFGRANGSADLIVTNGSYSWRYDREANNVTRLQVDGATRQLQYQWIEQLFARLNRTRTTPDVNEGTVPSPGLSPVSGAGMASGISTPELPAGQFGVSLDRATQVDGRTTYVLQIRPETDGNESALKNYSQTLWVDAETFFPVKQRTRFGTGDDRFSVTVTYRNLTVTDGFELGTFTFEPPADANVTRSDPLGGQRYDSPGETVENSTVPVAEPTVPPNFRFVSGRTMNTDFIRATTLVYRNETSRLLVHAYVTNESALPGNETTRNGTALNGTGTDGRPGERIQLGNRTARYTRAGLSRSVSWSCGEVQYSVSGRFVSKPLVVTVAESMSCPGSH